MTNRRLLKLTPDLLEDRRCVLPCILEAQAERLGDRPLVVFDGGDTWSYADTWDIARGTAAALQAIGVKRGDRVLVWLHDGPVMVRLMLGLVVLGAVYTPVNPAYRGAILEHVIGLADAELLVADDSLLGRLKVMTTGALRTVVAVGGHAGGNGDHGGDDGGRAGGDGDRVGDDGGRAGGDGDRVGDDGAHAGSDGGDAGGDGAAMGDGDSDHAGGDLGVTVLREDVLEPLAPERFVPPRDPIEPWDVHSIFFTSGTTGPSKAVPSTHLHIYQMAMDGLHFLDESDRYASPSAFFHIAGPYVFWGIPPRGASVAMIGTFRTRTFWERIRRTRATATILIGAMADFLLKAPAHPDDRGSGLRKVLQQPLTHDPSAFAERFGVEIYTQFDMTEVGPAIVSTSVAGAARPEKGYCGRAHPGFELRLVDEHDREVPVGEAGVLALRCGVPWVIAPGYFGMPEATAAAWRNGWFHTGDVMRRDAQGSYYYVDRAKDVIRRRGENISSFEVEAAVLSHPGVSAAAAYAVDVDVGEGEVMVAVETVDGVVVDPSDLCGFLEERLPPFMVPRYVRFVHPLPRSVTDKINKAGLRGEGVTPDTWDRIESDFDARRSA